MQNSDIKRRVTIVTPYVTKSLNGEACLVPLNSSRFTLLTNGMMGFTIGATIAIDAMNVKTFGFYPVRMSTVDDGSSTNSDSSK